ncbi:MAG: hypothetical protein ABI811_17005 [Acidobacteriota bacterium]
MDVLDRLRTIESGFLLAPRLITGPCGLIPHTQVHLSAHVHTSSAQAPGVTVVIRPYYQSPGSLALLKCSLRNEAGVVVRLMEAVSALEINIVNAVSSMVPDLGQQQVCMVIDWSTSRYAARLPSTPDDRRRYRDLHSVFPIMMDRYVKLYESILQTCGGVLVKRLLGHEEPLLSVEEIVEPDGLLPCGAAEVQRYYEKPEKKSGAGPKSSYAKIKLPANLTAKLRLSLNVDSENDLRYLLTSDVVTRTVRAFFPKVEPTRACVHLGFFHVDAPGTFAAILNPFDRNGFKILSSLVRTIGDGKNVLEALMEVPEGVLPPQLCADAPATGLEPTEELCKTVLKWMIKHVPQSDEDLFRKCGLEVGRPLYPRIEGKWNGRVAVLQLPKTSAAKLGGALRSGALRGESPNGSVKRNGSGAKHTLPPSLAGFVRDYIARKGALGVTANDLYAAFGDAKREIERSYLHSLLNRLRKSKELKYFEKRYYPYAEPVTEFV